jgi:hypothetical protein
MSSSGNSSPVPVDKGTPPANEKPKAVVEPVSEEKRWWTVAEDMDATEERLRPWENTVDKQKMDYNVPNYYTIAASGALSYDETTN